MKRFLAFALTVVFFSGCSSVSTNTTDVQQAQAVKSGFIIKRAVEDVKVSGSKKSVAKQSKVVVPFFRLNFVLNDKYRNTVGGGSVSTSKVNSSLEGVHGSVFQQVTEEVYADFLNKLSEAGYEVIPVEEAFGSSERYQKMESKYPIVKDDVVQAVPAGLKFPGKFRDPTAALSKEVDALVLKADLNVDFVVLNKNEKRFNITKDKSHVDVSQGVNVLGTVTAFSNQKMTLFTLQQPVLSLKSFGVVTDDTSAMTKASDTLYTASAWLTSQGLGSRRKTTKTLTVRADSMQYHAAAGDALSQTTGRIADSLYNLRK